MSATPPKTPPTTPLTAIMADSSGLGGSIDLWQPSE
jgi:hypothetical protein